MSTHRLFFALWPDERQRERLRDLISPLARQVEGRAVDRRNWHITLVYIGDFAVADTPALQAAAAELPFEPLRMRLDRLEFWPRPKIAALVPPATPPALEQLADGLKHIVQDAGVRPEERVYRPHITVIRNARAFEPLRLAQSAQVEWSRFELVASVPQPGGASYRPLKQ